MGKPRSSVTSRLAAAVLILVNMISLTASLLLFASSIWMISSPGTLAQLIERHGGHTVKALLPRETLSVQLGCALAALSGVLLLISCMALSGAVSRSPFLLLMYATLVFLLLLLECALFYYFSSGLIEKGVIEADGQWTHALRLAFKCCEHNATSLSPTSLVSRQPPWSCCGVPHYPDNCTLSGLFNKDCKQTITSWLHRYQTAIYTSLVILHLVLLSCSVVRRSRRAVSLPHR